MNTLAKRIHNITPADVRLTLTDGAEVVLSMRSAEFFQEAFQAEGVDDEDTVYRLVSDGADDPLVAGKQTDDGWTTAGEVVAVERAADEA
ncbi:hypothetical protein [Halorarius halobius]|uniref:hypothetical protein n=1 Tax=Halorarius halobius TaxID=2962671 RepID=UPI0020CE24E1|nr:hypothetical protein [Halorarius halobius]